LSQDLTIVERLDALLRVDARGALQRARELIDAAGADVNAIEYQQYLLVKGAAQAKIGETEEGARIMREVRGWAEEHGEQALLARCHRRMSALFRRIGDPALMLEHAVTAVHLLDADAPDAIRGDHVLGLADALGSSGCYSESLLRYEEAARLAKRCGDDFLQRGVLNNLAFTHYEDNRFTEAVAASERLLAEYKAGGLPLPSHCCDTIARSYAAVGRFQDAITVLEPLCSGEPDDFDDCDGLVMALLILTEVQRMAGALEPARMALARATAMIEQYSLTGRRAEVLHQEAELLAAGGFYRQAFETFRAFHIADGELRALERDRRGHTLHAALEATEARRSSDYFRELSERDPLTGLHNRRHMETQLSELLVIVVEDRAQLTVGLVDLDHFKRINDTRSHATGDEVLRQVAGILAAAAREVDDGLAVRLGGDEFLLLLPGVDRNDGIERLERVRTDIAAFQWAEVTDGMAVTVSIGSASAPEDGIDLAALLAFADENLYSAKHGRNRVVATLVR
jgi:two-component system, cell cycle response regulator